MLARTVGMTRDLTKGRVYGGLYGQGLKGDTQYLLKALPTLTTEDASANSKVFMDAFKGKKVTNFSGKKVYRGGLASEAFNVMETIADSRQPRTPFLGSGMTKALAGIKDYKPSRVNWTIQTSGSDYRDIELCLCISWFDRYSTEARLLLTIHDEFRFLVKSQDNLRAAYIIQCAHLYTRAFFTEALGLSGIPAGIMYHSAIDIDKVLRKDPYDPQVTPSQPEAISPGTCLSAKELLDLLKTAKR